MAGQVLEDVYDNCFAGRRVLVTGAGKGMYTFLYFLRFHGIKLIF